jgi:hypothetical protein
MEQQTATETKVATTETKVANTETKVAAIKRTIPNKQKSAIKLVMWTLSQVMEKEAMIAKIVEMFKVTDTIETIIEMVDAVEKSPEYTMMDTELTAIRNPKTKKRAKVSGDPDAIIKQLVDMATTETASGKKKGKAPKVEGEEKPKKAPRGKKAAPPAATEGTATDAPTTDVETEPKKKAPRAKKVAKVDDSKVDDSKVDDSKVDDSKAEPTTEAKPTTEVSTADGVTEPKKKAPRAKKAATTAEAKPTTEEAPKAPTDETAAPPAPKTPPAAAEPKAKKAPAKKTKTTVESNGTTPNGTTPETEPDETKTKAPKAPKTKAPSTKSSEIAPPNELVEVAEDLSEDEYMLLNEVVVDGKTYMVDSSQNVYNDFNDVIGKYENGVVTMNA